MDPQDVVTLVMSEEDPGMWVSQVERNQAGVRAPQNAVDVIWYELAVVTLGNVSCRQHVPLQLTSATEQPVQFSTVV